MSIDAAYQELEREIAAAFGDATFIRYAGTARLGKGGDSDEVPVLAAERQYPTFPLFWCYRDGNATNEPFQAVPWYPGLTYDNSQRHMEVWLVQFPQLDPKLHFIFGFTDIGLAAWNGVTPLQAGLVNAATVTPDKIRMNSIYFSSGVTLGFRGGTMRFSDTWYELPAVTSFAVLTDYIPADADTERWVSINISTAGAVGIVSGDTFSDAETNKKSFLPNTIPSGHLHLGSVLLANGLATGTDDLILPFKDMFLAPSSSSSSAVELASLTDVSSAAQVANLVLATPDGVAGEYSGRALVVDDIPALPASKITGLSATTTIDITGTAGETLAQNDNVYLAEDDTWYKVDIDSDPVRLALECGVVVESGGITAAGTGAIRKLGVVDGYTGLDAWEPVYAGVTAGGYTQTKPDPTAGGAQVAILKVGMAISDTEVLVNTFNPAIVFAKRDDALADDGTITIKHFSDTRARERSLRAFLSSTVPGSTLGGASYASANQDSNVALRQHAVATYTADRCTGGTASGSTEAVAASSAFDNDVNTRWQASTVISWLKYDFGAGNARTIRRVTVRSRNDASFSTAPKSFTIEGSNNNVDWTVLSTLANETGWTQNQIRTYDFVNSTAYRYIRLNITAVDGGPVAAVSEMEAFEAATFTTPKDKLAQSFQLSGAGDVGAVKLWLRKVGSPTGTLTLTIEGDSTGDPDGTPVDASADVDINEADLPTSYDWVEFELPSAVGLTAVPIYHLVLTTTRSASETDYVEWGADGSSPVYANGAMRSEVSAAWGLEGSRDAIFDVLTPSTAFDAPVLVGYWLGGNGDVEAVHGDTALANRDTHSTVKNTTGVTADLTLVVEIK